MRASDISRLRETNSGLSGQRFDSAEEVVRWHLAMQAQDFGPAKWSIGQRSARLVEMDVDKAVESGAILRTHLLRPTWHFVARDDIRWLLSLTGPRIQQQTGPRLKQLGLDPPTLARCVSVIAEAVRGSNHLTRNEISQLLDRSGLDYAGQRLPYILMHCELEAVICSGRLAGNKQTYALMDERAPSSGDFDREGAIQTLLRRYLSSHSPATVNDIHWWSGLKISEIRRGLESLRGELLTFVIEDLTFWSAPLETDRTNPGPIVAHLLQSYDELIVGYSESRFFGDPRSGTVRAAWRERTFPSSIALVRNKVAGHWKRRMDRQGVEIQVLLYEASRTSVERPLRSACDRFGEFHGRPVHLQITSIE